MTSSWIISGTKFITLFCTSSGKMWAFFSWCIIKFRAFFIYCFANIICFSTKYTFFTYREGIWITWFAFVIICIIKSALVICCVAFIISMISTIYCKYYLCIVCMFLFLVYKRILFPHHKNHRYQLIVLYQIS